MPLYDLTVVVFGPDPGTLGAGFRPGAVVQASRKSRRQWLVTRYSRRTLTSARRGKIYKAVAQGLCRASRHRRLVERLQVEGANWCCRPTAVFHVRVMGVNNGRESGRSLAGRSGEPRPQDSGAGQPSFARAGRRLRLCENPKDFAFTDTSRRQIGAGATFSTSPRGGGPPKIALLWSFHTASTRSSPQRDVWTG